MKPQDAAIADGDRGDAAEVSGAAGGASGGADGGVDGPEDAPGAGDDAPAILDATSEPETGSCSPCEGDWICGGDVQRIALVPEADGCTLMGLPGRKLLSPDGTVTEDGVVIGHADGSGARVTVTDANGAQWLFCAGAWTCRPR
jgi:hypothetical protein